LRYGWPAIIAAVVILVSSITATANDRRDSSPDFYFTRLMYTDMRGGMMARPPPYTCPELGGRSDYFPPQGRGWAIDYPGADCKFMDGVNRLTGVRVHPDPNVRAILDDDLFEFPYAYIVEPGRMYLSNAEAERLREWLLRGGFLHFDDFWGLREKANLETQLRKVFPDRRVEALPLSHPVFRSFFIIDEIVQIPNRGNGCRGGRTWESADDTEPQILGIADDDGRLMVLITYNSDLGDAWEYLDLPCYPADYAVPALRMGINFMVYAMTH
jgi:hypothetical protein